MGAPWNAILDKAEEAWKAYIDANKGTTLQYTPQGGGTAADITVYRAFDDETDEVKLPYILIAAGADEEATERVKEEGIWDVPILIRLACPKADTTRAVFRALVGALADFVEGEDLATHIQATSGLPADFTAQFWRTTGFRRFVDPDEDSIVAEWRGMLLCHGS